LKIGFSKKEISWIIKSDNLSNKRIEDYYLKEIIRPMKKLSLWQRVNLKKVTVCNIILGYFFMFYLW